MSARTVMLLEPLGRGGIADYTGELAAALAARGTDVLVVTAADHLYEGRTGVEVSGVVHWLRGRGRFGRAVRRARLAPLVNALRFAAVLPRIVVLGRRARLVHVQGFYFPPLLALAVAALRAGGATIVHTPHNTFDRGAGHRIARRRLAAGASRTIVHTQADIAQLPAPARNRVAVIPHGEYGALARRAGRADPEAARAQFAVRDSDVVALLFGQLRADKGVEDLLAAAAQVPELFVVLAGEDLGGLDGAEPLLALPTLRDRVTVRRGFQTLEEAAGLFAAADVVALPYSRASQSGVLLLAYGFERPVLVYPVGGLPEAVVEGETGWVSAEATPEALARTLAEIVAAGHGEARRRGLAGRRMAEERMSWEAIAARTADLYDEVARERAVRPRRRARRGHRGPRTDRGHRAGPCSPRQGRRDLPLPPRAHGGRGARGAVWRSTGAGLWSGMARPRRPWPPGC